jgi:hypothetical protein
MPSNLREMLTLARIKLDDLAVRRFPEPFLVAAANEGKNELCKIIREANENFFYASTTSTIAVASPPNGSIITLPSDFMQLREIKCTGQGYEDIGFQALSQSDPRFRQSLIDGGSFANGQGTSILLSPGSDIALAYSMAYIKFVPDMAVGTDYPADIASENYDFIVTWMICEGMRAGQDDRLQMYQDKLGSQRDSIMNSVNVRQVREPRFVRGYQEAEEQWG